MLNSYGGTFVGLKPVASTGDKHEKESQVVIIRIGTLKHLSVPKLEKPCKREFFITAVFDTDNLEETMEHQRNRSIIRQGDFENGYYTCSFNEHAITLPCKGKSFVRLYLSCISTIEENGERKIILNGLSYTDAYKISKLENYREDKSLTLVSDAAIAVKSNGNSTVMVKQGITGGILSFKIETRPSLGVYIPRDMLNSVLDAYKTEGEVYSPSNSNKFDVNRFNSLSNDKKFNMHITANQKTSGRKSGASSERSKVSETKKIYEKKVESAEKINTVKPIKKDNFVETKPVEPKKSFLGLKFGRGAKSPAAPETLKVGEQSVEKKNNLEKNEVVEEKNEVVEEKNEVLEEKNEVVEEKNEVVEEKNEVVEEKNEVVEEKNEVVEEGEEPGQKMENNVESQDQEKTDRSDKSVKSVKSDNSVKSDKSNKSDTLVKSSENLVDSEKNVTDEEKNGNEAKVESETDKLSDGGYTCNISNFV